MPATSDAQRRLFGAVLAAKRGEMKHPSAKIEKIAQGISESSAADFAKKPIKRKTNRQGVAKSLMQVPSGY